MFSADPVRDVTLHVSRGKVGSNSAPMSVKDAEVQQVGRYFRSADAILVGQTSTNQRFLTDVRQRYLRDGYPVFDALL